MFNKSIIFAVMAVALTGCSMMQNAEFKEQQSVLASSIETHVQDNSFNKVLTLERPPIQLQEIVEQSTPDWLLRDIELVVDNFPLNLVLRDLVGKGIQIEYGHGVDPIRPVSIYFEGSVEEALNVLSVTVDYGLLAEESKLNVAMQETKTFFIPAVSGDMSYQIGSSGSGGSGSALEGNISSTGSGDGQYSYTKATDYNAIAHIKLGVEALLKGVNDEGDVVALGFVEEVPLMSSLVVKTSPRVMGEVEKFINSSIEELSREVVLDIQVIEYLANDNSEVGLDLNGALSYVGNDYGLGVVSPTLGGVVQTGLDFQIGKNVFNGRLEGTTGLLKYLSTTGKVAVKTQQRVKTSNYQLQEIDLSESMSYISEIETNFADGSSNPTVSIKKSEIRDGVKMLVVPTVSKDAVQLRLTGTLSKFLGFENTEVFGVQVKDPRVRQSRFNTSGRYEYNKAIVVTHMRQEVTSTEGSKTAEVTTGVAGSKEIVDTLVVVTPRRTLKTN
ncbi:hypothetical protein [Vibrio mediterranei]|uniref:hypothetical protein n=1 Tax=Vibrio mediterranei TaxID=689 RepID=UPI0040695F13